MSRAYRIALTETLRRQFKVADGLQTKLELLPILPVERMAELLAAELERLGFERDGQIARRIDEDGAILTVDLEAGTITLGLTVEAELELSRSGRGNSAAAVRKTLRAQLERQAEARTEAQRQQITEQLERKLRDLQQELDGALNRATAAALREKAASLGEIEEISEEPETGSITIRVRV